MPTVSVIVPIYKAEKYIVRCLDSIREQTLSDFETVLVDDGSPDKSGKICDEYASKDSRFKVIHQPNGGVSRARQAGLDAAKGDYVIHADPDDWVESDWLESLYTEAVSSKADMVICDFERIYKNRTVYYNQRPSSCNNQDILLDLLKERIWGSCWNKLVRREIFQKYGIQFHPEMTIWEDLYVCCKLLINDVQVSYMPKCLYHYDSYSNENSFVRFQKDIHIRSRIIFVNTIEPLLADDRYSDCWYFRKARIKRWIFLMGNSKYSLVDTFPEINDRLINEAKNYRLWSLQGCIALSLRGHLKMAVALYRLAETIRTYKRKYKLR